MANLFGIITGLIYLIGSFLFEWHVGVIMALCYIGGGISSIFFEETK